MWIVTDLKKFDILTLSPNRIRYGCDYLRFNFLKQIPYLDRILTTLDYDNSNFMYDEENELQYTKLKLTTGPCILISVSYDNQPVPIGLYNVFTNGIKSVYSRLDFYWSYFRLEEMWYFPLGWYDNYIDSLTPEIPSITRVDYALDLFYKEKEVSLPKPKKICPNSLASDIKYKIMSVNRGRDSESWAIWSKSSKRNLLRMYDKLVDLGVKNKFFLYQDYLKYNTVHRLELQFGPAFCRHYYLDTLDVMFNKIANIFGLSKIDDNTPLFYKYSNKHEINDYTKLYYTKQFNGRAEKFFYSNVNPYLILLDYFDANTYWKDRLTHKKYLMELWLKLRDHDLLVEVLSNKKPVEEIFSL